MVGVVPIQVQSKVVFSLPNTGDGIVIFEEGHKKVGMLPAYVFYTKVVYPKGERDRMPIIFSKTRVSLICSLLE